MSLRNALERHKRWFVPAFLVVAAAGLGFSVVNSRSNAISSTPISRGYYTDDDGKSFFEDDVKKPFPFDRSGKLAYRAYVFRCGSRGTPFIGLIGRQGSTQKTASTTIGNYKSDSPTGPIEVRKPGTDKWVALDGQEGAELVRSLCPDGNPEWVRPGEE